MPAPRKRRPLVPVFAAAFGLGVSLVAFELVCRVYAELVVFPRLDAIRAKPNHFYRESESEILGYELLPSFAMEKEGRALKINRYGLRETSDALPRDERRIALIGDSVVFAKEVGQDETFSVLLQDRMDAGGERTRILNFGVPGYAFPQIVENLRIKGEIYSPTDAIYFLNLNDYARRDSRYEGADNALFRLYHRPDWMAPWFLRKAVYRYMKGGAWPLQRWYRWLAEGNREYGEIHLQQLIDDAKREEIRLSVVLIPIGVGYEAGHYTFDDLHDVIARFLREREIPVLNPIEEFSHDTPRLIDQMDHLRRPGHAQMAELVAGFIRKMDRAESSINL